MTGLVIPLASLFLGFNSGSGSNRKISKGIAQRELYGSLGSIHCLYRAMEAVKKTLTWAEPMSRSKVITEQTYLFIITTGYIIQNALFVPVTIS